MAVGIVVILVGIAVLAAVVIGVIMLIMMFINGSSKAMPEQPLDESEPPSRARASSNIGCILGIMAAVILGILLLLGIVMSLFFGARNASRQEQIRMNNNMQEQMLMEVKQMPVEEDAGSDSEVVEEQLPGTEDTTVKPEPSVIKKDDN